MSIRWDHLWTSYHLALVGARCRIVSEVSLFRAATLDNAEKRDEKLKRKHEVENAEPKARSAPRYRLRTKTRDTSFAVPVPKEIEDID